MIAPPRHVVAMSGGKDARAGYVYRGDRLTDPALRGAWCEAVRREDGRCIRGRNGNMLVRFGDRLAIVPARHLRRVRP